MQNVSSGKLLTSSETSADHTGGNGRRTVGSWKKNNDELFK